MATEQVGIAAAALRSGIPKTSGLSRFLNQYFYFCMSLLVAVVVVSGFGQTVDQNLIHATPVRPWLLWVHGSVFSGWVVFFIFQSLLVRTHNVKLHRATGWFGAGLGAVIPVLGISIAIVMDRFNVGTFHLPKEGYAFFAIQLLDMISFTIAFWLAVLWRGRPEFHRRLVLIATCVLTAAAFARIPHMGVISAYLGVDGLILLGAVRDLIVNRKIHAVYRYAVPALAVFQTVMVTLWAQHPAWWVKATEAIMG
jgi:hypothetical protein